MLDSGYLSQWLLLSAGWTVKKQQQQSVSCWAVIDRTAYSNSIINDFIHNSARKKPALGWEGEAGADFVCINPFTAMISFQNDQ